MIAHITGILERKSQNSAVVDVGGIGYELHIPECTYSALPEPGSPVQLHTHLHVREDALMLYGFSSVRELEFFRLLLGASSFPGLKRHLPDVEIVILRVLSERPRLDGRWLRSGFGRSMASQCLQCAGTLRCYPIRPGPALLCRRSACCHWTVG